MAGIDWTKYQSQAKGQAVPGQIQDEKMGRSFPVWQYRESVVSLVEYLRMHRDEGIFLYRDGDGYRLHFRPALKAKDLGTRRWEVAAHLYDFLYDARADMDQLLAQGESIPFLLRGNEAAGPP